MFRSVIRRMLVVALILLVATGSGILAIRIWLSRPAERVLLQGEIADFDQLPAQAPNRMLLCPPHFCNVMPDRISPVFDLPWKVLRDRWSDMVAGEPGVRLAAGDGDLGRITYIQRSPILHLPELITIEFIPLDDTHSSLALVSQSRYPIPDFGSNAQRVETWLRALRQ
jgi:hypothetical protein